MNQLYKQALIKTLSKSFLFLDTISKEIYTSRNIGPYYSSVGGHIRHILDFYESIFNGLDNGIIDLTDRKRDVLIETNPITAKSYVFKHINAIETIEFDTMNNNFELIDDYGMGKQSIWTNLSSIFAQANSHAIHHYAIIAQLLFANGITIDDKSFGYNPSTPMIAVNKIR